MWNTFSNRPKEGQVILVPTKDLKGLLIVTYANDVDTSNWHTPHLWSPAISLLNQNVWYDAEYDKMYNDPACFCGHPYHRHFDGYEGGAPVGCKYCHGGWGNEDVDYREEIPYPENFESLTEHERREVFCTHSSVCSGFKPKANIPAPAELPWRIPYDDANKGVNYW